MTVPSKILALVFNHIALPPKLPGRQDTEAEIEDVERELTRQLLDAIKTLKDNSDGEAVPVWQDVENSLKTCSLVNENGFVNKESLLDAFQKIQLGHTVIVRVGQQNASLLIRQSQDDKESVLFEAFETSPAVKQTLASQGALQWDFPGVAVSLPFSEFKTPAFQRSLATFIEKASVEPLEEFAAKSRKAGVEISENRDTVDPAIITQFLMTLLETNGTREYPPVLRKRIKDDVCWNTAELPWRRSPFWLTLRVSIQRLLYLRLGHGIGRCQYKFLMSYLMARLLGASVNILHPEQRNFLMTKLCRRLAKLETEKEISSPASYLTYERLFASIGPLCQQDIDFTATTLKNEWKSFRGKCLRKIPSLPLRAQDRDLRLTLPNSSGFLQNALNNPGHQETERRVVDPAALAQNATKNTTEQFAALTIRYDSLAQVERTIENEIREVPMSKSKCETLCVDLAGRIEDYMSAVGDAYHGDPEQMSTFILSIFELWVHMDKCAAAAFPLLHNYHPAFTPELLDVLLVSRLSSMKRLQEIQQYIQNRCTQAQMKTKTIFSDPFPGCFADRYFDLDAADNLHKLQEKIEVASSNCRKEKEAQLERVNAEYKSLAEKKAASSCTPRRKEDGSHDTRGCDLCFYNQRQKRLKIKVHEDFLPSRNNIVQKRVVVFELGIPKAFAAYRNTTWLIMNTLCPYRGPPTQKPKMLLANYSQLKKYMNSARCGGFSLASDKKSYLGTHYRRKKLPAKSNNVLLPLGLSFSYFDANHEIWSKDFPVLMTFAPHFAMRLPETFPFSKLYSSPDFAADGPGRSSYDIVAKIGQCPSELTTHEFMAHQNLMNGKNQRWISILAELGSSNINFSLQDTMVLFQRLALQAGPGSDNSDLRAIHVIFRDASFCNRLTEQVDQHVEAISANLRETNYMEILLTLTQQLCALCCRESSSQAHDLLLKIRRVTLNWIMLLREEMRNAQEVDISERAARYCFLSSLLCRRTFSAEAYSGTSLDGESFKCLVVATLAMQESLVVDLSKFSKTTSNMLVRDIKMTTRIGHLLQAAAAKHPVSIGMAIDAAWPEVDNSARMYTTWVCLPHPYDWWVMSTMQTTAQTMPQVVHYHLLEGHLLVDGTVIGKLPAEIRDSEILKELFGNQRLAAFPSNMPGMSHMLAVDKDGHRVHLGYRNHELVIRAQAFGTILELVPRHVFGEGSTADLPSPLIDNCVHWVDLTSGTLDIRRHPRIWKKGAWEINLHTHKAQRRQSSLALVDPHSSLFNSIARIFRNFEQPHMLMVSQAQSFNGNISVELKRMNLSFYVNRKKLLQCKQLSAEVDPNQDVGALYGLESMLVLRNVFNRSQRSVITTMGMVHFRRHGMHVAVRMENEGDYARYMIDTVVGRLRSPPEPRLLYHKALLHAFTSCFIPDLLTGRTGTEEALRWLQSGCCQPWSPLNPAIVNMLMVLSNLTPHREYYPKDKKRQQVVHWNPHLTTTIQHEAYQLVVDSIIKKSERLSLFELNDDANHESETPLVATHLHDRARWRRSIYERPDILSRATTQPQDLTYITRDGRASQNYSKRISHVREIVTLLRKRPTSIYTTFNLSGILQKWPVICGYTNESTPYLLDECLEADIALEWGRLINFCRTCKPEDIYHLVFHLGLISFGKSVDMTVIRVVAAFYLLKDLKEIEYPQYSAFTGFKVDEKPDLRKLEEHAKPFWQPYYGIHLGKGKKKNLETTEDIRRIELARQEHDQICLSETHRFATLLIGQWPCSEPSIDGFESRHLDIAQALAAIAPEWLRLYKNFRLSGHIREVEIILAHHWGSRTILKVPSVSNHQEMVWSPPRADVTPRLGEDLVRKPGPGPDLSHGLGSVKGWMKKKLTASWQTVFAKNKLSSTPEILEIARIAGSFMNSDCSVRSNYGQDLKESIAALKSVKRITEQKVSVDADFIKEIVRFNDEIARARADVDQHYNRITESMSRDDTRFSWLQQGNLWPCVTPASILQQLSSTSPCDFEPTMKDALISYGLSIVKLQRLIRMKEAFAKKDEGKLHQEHNNLGHSNWDPSIYPDWLLLEIDSDMQIRGEQATVAFEMIYPTSGSNSVLQMNMGQGKTSVIMPMVASALADGETLTRLLVPKALLFQTAQILQSRLGDLLGREITHIPFSRRTPTTPEFIQEFHGLHQDMLQRSGIILGVPEHASSFKLSGIQRVSDSKIPEATQMIEIQHWMNRVCRDILDECDFTLAVKTQLIYPSGAQLAVDGHPNRWEVSITVLDLVSHHIYDLARELPQSIDIVERATAAFPVAYLLRMDAEYALAQRIIDDICSGRTSILPIRRCTGEQQKALRNFISHEVINQSDADCVSRTFADMPKVRKNIYLLRGLFVHGILLLTLKKRWNIQYGLHPGRDPMAVPFHAKGVPSDQAEWGHPDVAILFTCLSFYYQGLSQKQLRDSIESVLRSDDPATTYERWTQASATLPKSLRFWNIINVDDEGQMATIWRHLRLTVVVINHFLCTFVFPVHAKQFSVKLQASGWDIPLHGSSSVLSPNDGAQRSGLTTGFSGTNDNRRLLPLTIKQQDLPELSHTNAEVLTYLLQKRNRDYRVAASLDGKRFSELGLLDYLKENRIRILIDAGAFVLEMDNLTLVRTWLQQDSDAQAAVYFGSDNKPWVFYQTGKIVPLLATPFSENFDKCLVYLDEAHTRGTDLKLPSDARGALTLGLNQTKDHTVQAAMRLRQLGTTQSITFIAPPEVNQSILDVCGKSANDHLDSSDVVIWLLDRTCMSNRELQPLYFAQGADYCHRMQAASSYKNFLTDSNHRRSYLGILQQPEQRTLEQLYKPQIPSHTDSSPSPVSSSLRLTGKLGEFTSELNDMQLRARVRESVASSALEEVEQEREIAYEIEEEREVQRPRAMKPLTFPGLHRAILRFVRSGKLEGTSGYIEAAEFLETTHLGVKYGIEASSFVPRLYVSTEFTKTVMLKPGERDDNFTRSVKWIIWGMQTENALVIIPEEAEELIPIIRAMANPPVHLILYAAPVTKRTLHFNHLDYYAIPSLPVEWKAPAWLPFELGILAGRLYFHFPEYSLLLNSFNLDSENDNAGESTKAALSRVRQTQAKTFLGFLQEWLAVRRQGQDVSHTPMGYVCQSWKLRSDHPFFASKTQQEPSGATGRLFHSEHHTARDEYEEYYDSDGGEEDMGEIYEGEDEGPDEYEIGGR